MRPCKRLPKVQPHAFYAGLRLVSLDGCNFEIPDEVAKSVFDELKTHLAQRRLSFTGHVQLMRRSQPRSGAFPP